MWLCVIVPTIHLVFLLQSLASMSTSPRPIKNLDELIPHQQRSDPHFSGPSMKHDPRFNFNPFIYGNDIDSVDIATRVAMVRKSGTQLLGHLYITYNTCIALIYCRCVSLLPLIYWVTFRSIHGYSGYTLDQLSGSSSAVLFARARSNLSSLAVLPLHRYRA